MGHFQYSSKLLKYQRVHHWRGVMIYGKIRDEIIRNGDFPFPNCRWNGCDRQILCPQLDPRVTYGLLYEPLAKWDAYSDSNGFDMGFKFNPRKIEEEDEVELRKIAVWTQKQGDDITHCTADSCFVPVIAWGSQSHWCPSDKLHQFVGPGTSISGHPGTYVRADNTTAWWTWQLNEVFTRLKDLESPATCQRLNWEDSSELQHLPSGND